MTELCPSQSSSMKYSTLADVETSGSADFRSLGIACTYEPSAQPGTLVTRTYQLYCLSSVK